MVLTRLAGILLLAPSLALVPGCGGSGDEPAKAPSTGPDKPAAGTPAPPVPQVRSAQAKVLADLLVQVRQDRQALAGLDTLTAPGRLAGHFAKALAGYRKLCAAWVPAGGKADPVLHALVGRLLKEVPRLVELIPGGPLLGQIPVIKPHGYGTLQYLLRFQAIRVQALHDALAGARVDEAHLQGLIKRFGTLKDKPEEPLQLNDENRHRIKETCTLAPARMLEEEGILLQQASDVVHMRRAGVAGGPAGSLLMEIFRTDMEVHQGLANDMKKTAEKASLKPGVPLPLSDLDGRAIKALLGAGRDFSYGLAGRLLSLAREDAERRKLEKGEGEKRGWTPVGLVVLDAWLARLENLCLALAPLVDRSRAGS